MTAPKAAATARASRPGGRKGRGESRTRGLKHLRPREVRIEPGLMAFAAEYARQQPVSAARGRGRPAGPVTAIEAAVATEHLRLRLIAVRRGAAKFTAIREATTALVIGARLLGWEKEVPSTKAVLRAVQSWPAPWYFFTHKGRRYTAVDPLIVADLYARDLKHRPRTVAPGNSCPS